MKYCVYGASSETIHPDYLAGGEELGRCLARHGHGLVFGGGNRGMMGAAARGVHEIREELGVQRGAALAKDEGPAILGISPSFFHIDDVLYPECTELILTETMRERKQLLEEHADGFIITPGGLGTMDEFFEIATLRQLGEHGKPIAILNLRGYYDPLQMMLRRAVEEQFLGADTAEVLRFFTEPESLVTWIESQKEHFLDWKKAKNKAR